VVEDSVAQQFNAYLQERANQPFGDVELISGRTLAPSAGLG
jgi:hypothetical protein